MTTKTVLVTGASGFIGSRIVAALLKEGATVRCLTRTPDQLRVAPWFADVEVIQGSVGDDLSASMRDVEVALYLVHSIGEEHDWVEREQRHASNFARAAESAGVQRIVYLGGLGGSDDALSRHLASRQRVGTALAATSVPTVELRAGVIVGSASASFEMLRYLVEVLPLMVTPKWVKTRCQPVAIVDVVSLLMAAILSEDEIAGIFEVGGADVVTYAQMMETYARLAGLGRRLLIPVPLLTPGLSSHWVGLVTPVPVPLARELVQSLVNEVVVNQNSACAAFHVSPLGLEGAMSRALHVTGEAAAPTSVSDADLFYFKPNELDPEWSGGTEYHDEKIRSSTDATPEQVFEELCTIGGVKGWYSGRWLWKLRGVLDQLFGGPGLRPGRQTELRAGDALDFWRIEEVTPPTTLRLRAEMRLPGLATLTWRITEHGANTMVRQTASFRPRGLLGRLYWAAVLPFHGFIFFTMLARIVAAAESKSPV